MFITSEPYRQELGDGLVLKSVAAERDVARLAQFNGAIHGAAVGALTRELLTTHPHTRAEHWLFVEDEPSGEIASALCLIPRTLRYEDVELHAGEMGIVGTLEKYQQRGLVRAQVHRHQEQLRAAHCDLGIIQGIPYFYRQFGYDYAIPLEGGWRVDLHLIPDTADDAAPRYSFRQATLADLPALMALYDAAAQDLHISTIRGAEIWRYLLDSAPQSETYAETWLVLDDTNRPAGYFRVSLYGFGEGLIVSETSRLNYAATRAVLQQLKTLARDREKPYIRLCLPEQSALIQTAQYLGAHDLKHYAWQIYIVDLANLLYKLAPILERRIAASPFAGLTRCVYLNLYREVYELHFEQGKLGAVVKKEKCDSMSILLPPDLVAPLVLGYRSRAELKRAHHDVFIESLLCEGELAQLTDVLFPKVAAYIYPIY